ncbi:MAG: hypothetical protein Q9207_002978 [Kuettlingeria erythrocarpa]
MPIVVARASADAQKHGRPSPNPNPNHPVRATQIQPRNGVGFRASQEVVTPSIHDSSSTPPSHKDTVKDRNPHSMVGELRGNNGMPTYPFFFMRDDLQAGICVFKDVKTYGLQPTWQALHHDDEGNPGRCLFTIISDPTMDPDGDHVVSDYDPDDLLQDPGDRIDRIAPGRACVFSMPVTPRGGSRNLPAAKLIPCVFVALGWLSEHEAGKAEKQTYYVVLLNLSTDPISVWLMYDYHLREELECAVRWNNPINGYGNRLFIDGDIGRGLASERVSYLDRYKGFRKHYTNEEDMCPKANHSQTTTPDHKSTRRPLVDGESPAKRSQISSSSKESAGRDSDVESALSPVADNDQIAGTLRNTEHHDMCFSKSKRPFDLAMLAPDVDKWDLRNGLDSEEVKVCLHATSMRLGSSMRVRAATEDERDGLAAANEHVDLRALC